jgi:hypothetical protein
MKYFSGRLENHPEIRQALRGLRALFVSKLTQSQLRSQTQISFKVQHFVQCVVRRIVASVDGMNLGWNADNMITAVTMARSLIETVALVHAVSQDIKLASEEENFIKANEVLNSAMLSSRHPVFAQAAALEPTRVTKLVARIDSEFLGSSTPKVKDQYEFLCEFVHPNGPGLLMLYADGRYSTDDISYELSTEQREAIFKALLESPLGLVVLALPLLHDILARLPELERLSTADPKRTNKEP